MRNETAPAKPVGDEKARGKLIFKLDEVSRLTKLDIETLEAWEREFPFLLAGRMGSGQKFFRQQDVDIILRIKELLSQKTLTMAGVKRRIEDEFRLVHPTSVHPEKLRKALVGVREELQEIAASLAKKPRKT